jgi:hypothetical protein
MIPRVYAGTMLSPRGGKHLLVHCCRPITWLGCTLNQPGPRPGGFVVPLLSVFMVSFLCSPRPRAANRTLHG